MSNLAVDVVKRSKRRPNEKYDPDKLYDSLVRSCRSVHLPAGEASDIARKVTAAVDAWCGGKTVVTTIDIRKAASRHLEKYNSDVAYIYHSHKVIL